jgi:hypothetical protein
MAATSKPRIIVFKADGAIAKGQPVKFGSDNDHVAAATAASDKSFGIAQNAAVNAGDKVEVAIAGGGAKVLAGGSINAGDFLVPAASGVVSSAQQRRSRCCHRDALGRLGGHLLGRSRPVDPLNQSLMQKGI